MMRIWGRLYAQDGSYQWAAVTTDPDGSNDYVYLTNLAQVIKLSPNESPFFANYGIPGQLSVIQQIQPDLFAVRTQRQFAPFFGSLILAKISSDPPTYRINALTRAGVPFRPDVPV